MDDLVWLDIGDARIAGQGRGPVGGKPDGEAPEGVLVDVGDVPAVRRARFPAAAATSGRCELASLAARTASALKTTM
jgi:hypothetical protein